MCHAVFLTCEFKKEAVSLFKQQDLTLAEVSRNLDIGHKSLKTWVALYDAGALKASMALPSYHQTSYAYVS